MSYTMLQMVQQTAAELNLPVPQFVAGNQTQDVQQILALMNGAGYDLVKEHNWQGLEKQYRFYTEYFNATADTIDGSATLLNVSHTEGLDSSYSVSGYGINQDTNVVSRDTQTIVTLNQECSQSGVQQSILFAKTEYDMPFDFETITNRTQWQKTQHWEMLGPEDAQQWQWLKSGYIATGPRVRWRILGNKFQIWPLPTSKSYLGFEYRSKAWAISPTGQAKNSFTQDNDTTLFDDRLMVLATKLKYFQIKGFDTTSLQQDYNRYLSVVKAQDKGGATLSFAPYPTQVLIGWANIPDSNYGT